LKASLKQPLTFIRFPVFSKQTPVGKKNLLHHLSLVPGHNSMLVAPARFTFLATAFLATGALAEPVQPRDFIR